MFMNSGDCIISEGLRALLRDNIDKNKCYACSVRWDNNAKISHPIILPWLLKMPMHQGMIFPKKFLYQNKFDKNFPVCADLDHKIIAYKNDMLSVKNYVVALCESGGVSQNIFDYQRLHLGAKENYLLAKKHYGNVCAYVNYIKFFLINARKVFSA